jgi:hypothetical protein
MPPTRYVKVDFDPNAHRIVLTFYPCRHRQILEGADLENAQHSSRDLQEFERIHRVCWECHYLLDVNDHA